MKRNHSWIDFPPTGVIDDRERLLINPASLTLLAGVTLIVVGPSKRAVAKALKQPFSRLRDSELERLRYLPQARGGGRVRLLRRLRRLVPPLLSVRPVVPACLPAAPSQCSSTAAPS